MQATTQTEESLDQHSNTTFLNKLKKSIRANLKPPANLDMVEWAERYYMLSSDDSSNPGKFRVSRAPYQREVLLAIGDNTNQEIVLLFSSQTGKTLIQLITMGYFSHAKPSPILFVLPDAEIGLDFSKRRLAPMVRNSPELKQLFASNDTGNNTLTSKFFPGGSITIASAGIPTDLTSRPVRVILADEIDKYPASTKSAGDPVLLAKQRTATFTHNKKIILTSTPLIKGESRIDLAYQNGTQGVYHHRCIHCDELFAPVWDNVHWLTIEDEPKPETASLICPHCGGLHNDSERQRSVDNGCWIHRFPDRKVKSFFVNAISSPWVQLSDLVEQYITALPNQNMYRQFVNEVLGLPYESQGDRVDNIQFGDRLEHYTKDSLPNDILFLTAGVDTQANRLEATVYGWGKDLESWEVDYFQVQGVPSEPSTWRQLHSELQQDYIREDGQQLKLLKTGIDTGGNDSISGGFSQYVKEFCKKYAQFGYMAFKGASTAQKTIFPSIKRKASNIYLIDTNMAKEMLYSNLKKTKPGPGYIHFHSGLDGEFFNQLTSEERVKETKNGRTKIFYKRISGRSAEVLDTSVYALAARLSLSSSIESNNMLKRKQTVREQTINSNQSDYLLNLPTVAPAPSQTENVMPTPIVGTPNKYAKLFNKGM